MSVRVTGFTSPRNGHQHLLKHLVRLTEVARKGPGAADVERWEALITDPPLLSGVGDRRRHALEQLAQVDGCLARGGVTSGVPCEGCSDGAAIREVDQRLDPLLRAYVEAARATVAWAIGNHDRKALLAYRGEKGPVLEAFDTRHVYVVGRLEPATGEVRVVTCYRATDLSFKARTLDFARRRAAFARAGTLLADLPFEAAGVAHVVS